MNAFERLLFKNSVSLSRYMSLCLYKKKTWVLSEK